MSTNVKTGGIGRAMSAKKLATLAMLTAVAYLVMVILRIPIVQLMPFLKYDAKDVIIVIGGFLYGPLSAAMISVVVSFLEMITVSESGVIGMIMNILSTCAFVCPAAFLYRKRQTLKSAVAGLTIGVLFMTMVMILWNYLMVPLYTPNMSREVVAGYLVPVFLPFNLLKGGLNAAITMLLYKPLVMALRKTKLVPASEGSSGQKGSFKWGPVLISGVALITFVLLAMALAGKL
ncbi:ECF transporter S component [Christensenellaceae bacterium OttesenSCG-928-M15]|nr:ECF transporter S component [Christensenellaceae bacterium OttesenSCG-928-M15]